MARSGNQYYPGAHRGDWYEDNYGGDAMESNVIVWHTTETDSLPGYGGGSSAPNFTAVPDFGRERLDWWQHFRFDTSARALVNRSGGVETNTLNVVQVELTGTCDPRYAESRREWGRAGRDYIYWPEAPRWALADLARFARWCHDEHGVQLRSPVEWLSYPHSYGNHRARLSGSQWIQTYGHVGHQHVPENAHGDPGKLDIPWVLDMAKNKSWDGNEDMAITDEDVQRIAHAVINYDGIEPLNPTKENPYHQVENVFTDILQALNRLEKGVDKLAVGGVDLDALAVKVADLLADRLAK